MKFLKCIIILLFLISCSSIQKVKTSSLKPTKFTFKKSMIFSNDGIAKLKSMQDSLVNISYASSEKDSLLRSEQLINFLTTTPETEIIVEVKGDSIWRYTKQKDKIIGDYILISEEQCVLYYYDKSKSINYKKHNLFSENGKYYIKEDRRDTKIIIGFDCYNLNIVKKDSTNDIGDTIYETYVTEEIPLPFHSIINVGKYLPNKFPLEIKIYEKGLPGIIETYELINYIE